MPTRDAIPYRLLAQASQRPAAIAYQHKMDGRWQAVSWREFADQVRAAARALIALGVPRGGKVAILGFNRPEWVIFDHAAMMVGSAPAGIYTTCSSEQVEYIVHHSESTVVLVETAAQLAKVKQARARLPLLSTIVLMRGPGARSEGDVLAWEDFLARGAGISEAALDERIDTIEPTALATLIYTSGTTGPPKGVMLSHGNLAWTARLLAEFRIITSSDISLSYLPLSHIAEQMLTIHMPATTGSAVCFAESLDKIADNLKECRPTVFFGVPRLWEKFHAALAAKLGETTGARRRLVQWARRVCSEVNARRDRSEALPRTLELQYRLADRIVIGKIKAALGLERARSLLTGSAPIAPDVLQFFASLDLPIREIYGQSEDCGPTSINLIGQTKIGSVGPPLPGLQVRIAEDGEIQVQGPSVFLGYYKDPEATADALVDGWLCSGDLGAFDRDGFLTITGRKKEIIITAGGKNIAPKNIETALKQLPVVGEAVVIGDRRKYLTALVTIDEDAAKQLAPGAEPAALAAAPEVRAAIQAQIDRVNESLSRVEQVKRFAVLPRPFGVDTGELTPTLKVKRKVVAEKYATEIDAMYAESAPASAGKGAG
jgi:long-chain acyl-CoA synthetase